MFKASQTFSRLQYSEKKHLGECWLSMLKCSFSIISACNFYVLKVIIALKLVSGIFSAIICPKRGLLFHWNAQSIFKFVDSKSSNIFSWCVMYRKDENPDSSKKRVMKHDLSMLFQLKFDKFGCWSKSFWVNQTRQSVMLLRMLAMKRCFCLPREIESLCYAARFARRILRPLVKHAVLRQWHGFRV